MARKTTRRGEIVLQNLVMPDPAICTEADLYLHRDGGAHLLSARPMVLFRHGGTIWSDTYMNVLNLSNWTRHGRLHGLKLRLEGLGRFIVTVTLLRRWGDPIWSSEDIRDLTPEGIELDLDILLAPALPGQPAPLTEGLVYFRLIAIEHEARFTGGAWLTRCPDPAPVRLAIAVTTFRREAEVARTAARITGFLEAERSRLGAPVRLFLIDNGGTAAPAPHPLLTVVKNPNLGGAGGFARGLAEAQDGGFTHCLFMDDDASMQMEALVRTLGFLRLARSPRAAVSGAMISEARRWAMWENGSVFNGACRPQFVGTDLRDAASVAHMELAAARPKPDHFYAGWWFFAFPVAQVAHWPYPFFVRGDDISFSLANKFDTATLNGVVSFQEDFSVKESPLTLYLDLRNHLHHHLVHADLDLGARGSAKVALRFFVRSIVRMHYDSAEAQLEAWEDVLRGPGFFAANADMARRRPQISALARTEAWKPMDPPPPGTRGPEGYGRRGDQIMKYTLNGHLIPFWSWFGRKVVVPSDCRGLIWPIWGAVEARFNDGTGARGYVVRHSKRRFLALARRAIGLTRRWLREYPELQAAHRRGYAELAGRDFWETQFRPAPAVAAIAAAPAGEAASVVLPEAAAAAALDAIPPEAVPAEAPAALAGAVPAEAAPAEAPAGQPEAVPAEAPAGLPEAGSPEPAAGAAAAPLDGPEQSHYKPAAV